MPGFAPLTSRGSQQYRYCKYFKLKLSSCLNDELLALFSDTDWFTHVVLVNFNGGDSFKNLMLNYRARSIYKKSVTLLNEFAYNNFANLAINCMNFKPVYFALIVFI